MPPRRALAAIPDRGPIRDGIYIRVSAVMGREDEHFLSPDLQRAAITRARAAAPGPSIMVGEWADIDVSGGSMDRPKLNEALELAAAGGLDRLWVYDLSRWARVTTEGLAELERIEALGCHVMSTAEPVDLATPEGYFSATMMLAVAKMRRDQIARSWRQVAEHRVAAGMFHGSNAPLGYQLQRKVGLLPHPEEAPAVVRAFTRYADGWRLWHVAQAFRAETGRSRTYPVTVRRMLANPVYVGQVRLGDRTFPGQHETLIEAATWEIVQRRLEREARIPSRRLAIAHPVSGLVCCAHCTRPLQLHHERSRPGHGSEKWRLCCCGKTDIADCDGPGRPDADAIVVVLLDMLADRIARLKVDTVEQGARSAARTRAKVDVTRLRRELEDLGAARGRLAVDHARRLVADDPYARADTELAAEEARLLQVLVDAEPIAYSPATGTQVRLGETLLACWDDATVEEQHRGLQTVLRRATIRRARAWREPVEERLVPDWL